MKVEVELADEDLEVEGTEHRKNGLDEVSKPHRILPTGKAKHIDREKLVRQVKTVP